MNIPVRLACICLTFAVALPVAAQEWPSRPIKLVIPFAPAGSTDILGRMVAQKLGNALGQSVIVENKPGAAGNLGTDVVAKASADC